MGNSKTDWNLSSVDATELHRRKKKRKFSLLTFVKLSLSFTEVTD